MRLSNRLAQGKLFHLSADTYYLMLENFSLEEACNQARQLKEILQGDYLITPPGRPSLSESMLKIAQITVHLGVSSYPLWKLKDLLARSSKNVLIRSSIESTVAHLRVRIAASMVELLHFGRNQGGNCVVGWDPELWGFKRIG